MEDNKAPAVKKQKNIITPGQDLRKMRIRSGLSSTDMAEAIGVKSRKTIENWERDFCHPTANQWLQFCLITGYDPSKVVAQTLIRNQLDSDMKQNIDLALCLPDS